MKQTKKRNKNLPDVMNYAFCRPSKTNKNKPKNSKKIACSFSHFVFFIKLILGQAYFRFYFIRLT